jgi:hypothetical protein
MRKKEAAYRERQRLNLAQTVKANDVLKGVRARETEKDRQADLAVEGEQLIF